MSVFMQPIYTQTVSASGGVASVVFNNIPQTFQDLVVVSSARSTSAGTIGTDLGMLINGNTNAVYSDTGIYATGVAAGTFNNAALNSFVGGMVNAGATTASTFAVSEAYIANYVSNTYKQVMVTAATENNSASNYIITYSNSAQISAPITSITLRSADGANLAQHSSFTIYGISKNYDVVVPGTPTITSVTDVAGSVAVAFTAPSSGGDVDYYTVTTTPTSTTSYGTRSPINATGLTLGTSYTFNVNAVNGFGATSSAASSAVTTNSNYASIATYTLGSAASTVTFTNIPQNYKHLQLRILARGTTANIADYAFFQINSISNGSARYMLGNYSSVTSAVYNGSGQPLSFTLPCANAWGSAHGVVIIDIADYTSSVHWKTGRITGGFGSNGTGQQFEWTYLAGLQAPVGSINFNAWGATSFAANSQFALYGIA
jgi:hypothetical protein